MGDVCYCDQYDCHGITALVEGTATLRAERDALRQEVERLRGRLRDLEDIDKVCDSVVEDHARDVARIATLEAEVERLVLPATLLPGQLAAAHERIEALEAALREALKRWSTFYVSGAELAAYEDACAALGPQQGKGEP